MSWIDLYNIYINNQYFWDIYSTVFINFCTYFDSFILDLQFTFSFPWTKTLDSTNILMSNLKSGEVLDLFLQLDEHHILTVPFFSTRSLCFTCLFIFSIQFNASFILVFFFKFILAHLFELWVSYDPF